MQIQFDLGVRRMICTFWMAIVYDRRFVGKAMSLLLLLLLLLTTTMVLVLKYLVLK